VALEGREGGKGWGGSMTAAVYFIHTDDFDRYYIGSTGSPHTRRKHHFTQLRKGAHHCAPLQRTFAKLGEDALRFSVAATCQSRQAASQLEHDLLGFHFRKPGCLNVSSNGLMPAQCPEVVAKRNATLKGEAHRAKASTLARQWRQENPEAAKAADAKSAATRAGSTAWRAANKERSRQQAAQPGATAAFVERIARYYANGGVNGFAKSVVRIGCDGAEATFPSAQAAARATPGAHFSGISACCLGKRNSNGGYRWRFA